MLSGTPVEITEQIKKFCKEIEKSQKPVYVSVKPDPESKIQDCFLNVKAKVEKDGGQIQFGWAIVESPKMMNEAQFHAIWVSPENEHIDITPSERGGVQRILFLPDTALEYDYVSDCKRICNKFQPLTANPLVHRFIVLTQQIFDIEETHSTGRLIDLRGLVLEQFEELKQERALIYLQLMSQPQRGEPRRNDPCSCGSGLKFKKCCGKQ